MSKRVLIIGAGPGGLAAGLLLARAGLQVRIVERLPFVGGRTSTFATPQGFRFDLGPTFFLYPPVLEQIYKLLGRDLFAEIEMHGSTRSTACSSAAAGASTPPRRSSG